MLPKIKVPTFDITIPNEAGTYKARSMVVAEEKILLMAKESGERADQLNAILQVVNNCILMPKGFKAEELPYYKLEYLFLKIREQSVSNKARVSYRDQEDDKVRDFVVDLADVQLKCDEEKDNKIVLGDDVVMILRYPSAKMYASKEFQEQKPETIMEYLISNCIDKIFEGDKAHDPKVASKAELKEFIESIPSKQFEEIQNYFAGIPSLYYKIEYTNDMGTKREIELKTLDDFFTF